MVAEVLMEPFADPAGLDTDLPGLESTLAAILKAKVEESGGKSKANWNGKKTQNCFL